MAPHQPDNRQTQNIFLMDVKAKLFAAARERHPILARYHNDWATAEIAKQYVKNKRNNAYKNGWLEPPAKYSHLKANAAKRNPSAPRSRQNKLANAKIAKKRVTAKKTSTSKKAAVKKGKAKAVVSDDEDEEMSDAESEGAMEEDD
ncbi:hypothetical protein DFH08DRAFT_1089462 [Mycena albidolilacea]|uniref:Uncharacterized protein n=1 Tax=Mycena albidolilacea TaxID=1033008 RepID=A0AAD6Z227_9AGAR|nr:hypothetical protein DFH08DRAFT_1089462 [Mycena albidolilacea]